MYAENRQRPGSIVPRLR